jgi:hypothetical protein
MTAQERLQSMEYRVKFGHLRLDAVRGWRTAKRDGGHRLYASGWRESFRETIPGDSVNTRDLCHAMARWL